MAHSVQVDVMVPEETEPPLNPSLVSHEQFDTLLLWAKENGYSDVIIATDRPVYYRKHRRTYKSRKLSLGESATHFIVKYVASDGAMVKVLGGNPVDRGYQTAKDPQTDEFVGFRVNIKRIHSNTTQKAVQLVMRTIPGAPWELEKHNLDPELERYCFPKMGMVMIAGPMGSGKTTLGASLIREKSFRSHDNILCVEDPVEFDHALTLDSPIQITQTEIGKGVPDWKTALASMLRSSVDTVYWGESRDLVSIRGLCTACDLGTAVYTTVHANSVATTPARMIREFPENERAGMQAAILNSLQVLVYQQLLPSSDGGVVPFREYYCFDQSSKMDLIDKPLSELSTAILQKQQLAGTDGPTILKRLLDDGLITRQVYSIQKEMFEKENVSTNHG